MKRRMKSTLLSNVGSTRNCPFATEGIEMPFSSTPRATVTMFGSATVIFRNGRDASRCSWVRCAG